MSAPVRSGQDRRRYAPAAGRVYEPLLTEGGRTMAETKEAFVGIDVAKLRNAVAVAAAGRDGEVRFYGEVDASAESMRRLAAKLAGKYERLHFCYEAGPTGRSSGSRPPSRPDCRGDQATLALQLLPLPFIVRT